MAYCTAQDMLERFGAREMADASDRAQTGEMDASVVSTACEDASAEVDGRIARRYSVPLTSAPRLIKLLACDIARYRLFATRPHEEARRRYEAAIAVLEEIASGGLSLGADEAKPAASSIRVCAGRPVFGPAAQEAYVRGLR